MILFILLTIHTFFGACTEVKADQHPESNIETIEAPVLVSEVTPTVLEEAPVAPIKEVLEDVETKENPIVLEKEVETKVEAVAVEETTPLSVEEVAIESLVVEAPLEIDTDQKIEESVIQEDLKPTIDNPMEEAVVGHGDFDALLSKYVKNGRVNYSGFKSDSNFGAYLDYLSNNAPSTSDKSNAALAFWMNAYNAFTIKLITDNLPVKSIMDLDGGKPWDKKWIKMGGKTYSLNQIEHDIIRPVFNEPRIHFAVVCAANSCPPIASYAFTAGNVDSKLEALTSAFINNPKFNQLSESKITISPIFDWYGGDFGDVAAYVQKYAKSSVSSNAKVKFTAYDWGLNKQ